MKGVRERGREDGGREGGGYGSKIENTHENM